MSGLLVGLSYIILPGWFILIGFIPLLMVWQREGGSVRRIVLTGWLMQFVASLINFGWLGEAASNYFHGTWYLTVGVALVYACIGLWHIPIAGGIVALLQKRYRLPSPQFFLLTAVTLWLLEALLPSFLPSNWGYTFFFAGLPIYHFADWVGFSGLSLFVYLTNVWIAWAILDARGKLAFNWRKLVAPTAVFLVLNVLGHFHGKTTSGGGGRDEVSLLIVQPWDQLYPEAKVDAEFPGKVVAELVAYTKSQLAGHLLSPDLILWPELSYPVEINPLSDEIPQFEPVEAMIREYNAPLLMGALVSAVDPEVDYGPNRTYSHNAAILFNRSTSREALYRKEILFPFVEQYPLAEYLPRRIYQYIPRQRLIPGYNEALVESGRFRLGIEICYEGIFPEHTLWQARMGANLLVSLSHDGWFADTLGVKQHYLMTMARAIEFRLPMVRVSQSGVSAVILPDGTFLTESPESESWAERVTLPVEIEPELSFYARYPNILLIISVGAWFSLVLLAHFNRKKLS